MVKCYFTKINLFWIKPFSKRFDVSILVLVDLALRRGFTCTHRGNVLCFNPCFSGFSSSTCLLLNYLIYLTCFNTCFSGFSSSTLIYIAGPYRGDSFNPCFSGFSSSTAAISPSLPSFFLFPCSFSSSSFHIYFLFNYI